MAPQSLLALSRDAFDELLDRKSLKLLVQPRQLLVLGAFDAVFWSIAEQAMPPISKSPMPRWALMLLRMASRDGVQNRFAGGH